MVPAALKIVRLKPTRKVGITRSAFLFTLQLHRTLKMSGCISLCCTVYNCDKLAFGSSVELVQLACCSRDD